MKILSHNIAMSYFFLPVTCSYCLYNNEDRTEDDQGTQKHGKDQSQ